MAILAICSFAEMAWSIDPKGAERISVWSFCAMPLRSVLDRAASSGSAAVVAAIP